MKKQARMRLAVKKKVIGQLGIGSELEGDK